MIFINSDFGAELIIIDVDALRLVKGRFLGDEASETA